MATPQDFLRGFHSSAEESGDSAARSTRYKKEEAAGHIAKIFVIGFFLVIFTILLIGLDFFRGTAWSSNEYKEMFIAISTLLASPLSFILGYYFKSSQETRNR